MWFAWNRSLISHDPVNYAVNERIMQAVSDDTPFLSANDSFIDIVPVSSRLGCSGKEVNSVRFNDTF